jgi:hypothetical protein
MFECQTLFCPVLLTVQPSTYHMPQSTVITVVVVVSRSFEAFGEGTRWQDDRS